MSDGVPTPSLFDQPWPLTVIKYNYSNYHWGMPPKWSSTPGAEAFLIIIRPSTLAPRRRLPYVGSTSTILKLPTITTGCNQSNWMARGGRCTLVSTHVHIMRWVPKPPKPRFLCVKANRTSPFWLAGTASRGLLLPTVVTFNMLHTTYTYV